MKKTFFILMTVIISCSCAFAETNFTRALANCSNYSQEGSIPFQGEIFNIKITLQKGKNGTCTYKEKIYQDIGYEQLTCNFDKNQLQFITKSMIEFSNLFKNEIAKNKIFEAKLSSNGVVFQKYLIEPKICSISHFKK